MDQNTIQYIDTEARLDAILPHLQEAKQIAVDLEFDNNRYRYGFNLCLMQIMAGDQCYLIDPVNHDLDISPVFPILENPEVDTVVFSFREDLALLHAMGCRPQGIYDIGLAIRLLDYTQTSLGTVLEEFLDISLDKEAQTSNWFTRPLSEEQLSYAALDVAHLFELKSIVAGRLEAKKTCDWVRQENQHFEQQDFSSTSKVPVIKDKDKKDLNEVQWYVFKALMTYRESLAEENNIPPGRTIRTDYLKEILLINGLRYWEKNRGTHKLVRTSEHKEEVRELVKRATELAIEKGLSPERSSRGRLSKEEYQAAKERRWEKEHYLDFVAKPIQQYLREEYGEEFAIFLLSNRLATDLFHDQSISLPAYRIELIKKAAESVDFDSKSQEIYAKSLGLL